MQPACARTGAGSCAAPWSCWAMRRCTAPPGWTWPMAAPCALRCRAATGCRPPAMISTTPFPAMNWAPGAAAWAGARWRGWRISSSNCSARPVSAAPGCRPSMGSRWWVTPCRVRKASGPCCCCACAMRPRAMRCCARNGGWAGVCRCPSSMCCPTMAATTMCWAWRARTWWTRGATGRSAWWPWATACGSTTRASRPCSVCWRGRTPRLADGCGLRGAGLCRGAGRWLAPAQGLAAFGDIVARERNRFLAACQLHLENGDVLVAEGGFRHGQIELPHAAKALVVERGGLVAARHEALAPQPQRARIVQAQHFDIGDHEAAAFDGRRELRQGRDVAAREDVALYPWIVEVGHIAVADEVQQHHAIVGQQLPALAEEGVVKTRAHMLEHAHRDDAVEGAARVAVVFQAVAESVRARGLAGTLAGARQLLAGQRHARHMARASHLRQGARQSAPAEIR